MFYLVYHSTISFHSSKMFSEESGILLCKDVVDFCFQYSNLV